MNDPSEDTQAGLPEGIDPGRFRALVRLAAAEDLGERGDITSQIAGLSGRADGAIVARATGVFCGGELLPALMRELAPDVDVRVTADGAGVRVAAGDRVAELAGPGASLLAAERTVLNVLQRLSGVATATARYVAAIAGTKAAIYDTRKTIPGWRDLDKYAVRCGGGRNHRAGLYDAVLLKDNHLAGVETDRLAFSLFEMLNRAGELLPPPHFVQVEVDRLDQLDAVLKVVGVDIVLLDNFSVADMVEAVRRRFAAGLSGKVELEASGGVTLETVRAIAETGVERISVGAITHSAPAFDLSLDVTSAG